MWHVRYRPHVAQRPAQPPDASSYRVRPATPTRPATSRTSGATPPGPGPSPPRPGWTTPAWPASGAGTWPRPCCTPPRPQPSCCWPAVSPAPSRHPSRPVPRHAGAGPGTPGRHRRGSGHRGLPRTRRGGPPAHRHRPPAALRGRPAPRHQPVPLVEYSISSTVMVLLICTYTGITGLGAVIGIAGANVTMVLFGWLQEQMNSPGRSRTTMLPFWFGCIAGAAPDRPLAQLRPRREGIPRAQPRRQERARLAGLRRLAGHLTPPLGRWAPRGGTGGATGGGRTVADGTELGVRRGNVRRAGRQRR